LVTLHKRGLAVTRAGQECVCVCVCVFSGLTVELNMALIVYLMGLLANTG